jgi:hypothetical protein
MTFCSKWMLFVPGVLLTALAAACIGRPTATPYPAQSRFTSSGVTEISGTVVDQDGAPVEGATIRIQTTLYAVASDQQGHFVLGRVEAGQPVTVSAWKNLYYCAKEDNVRPPASDIRLVLRKYQSGDNANYSWVPPTGENSCYSCKPGVTQVWLENDAHGKSAANPRFLSMYYGTDVRGNLSPPTRYARARDYGRVPIPPDLTKPYFGPGYKLDFPDSAGNCAACHIPSAAINDPYGVDPKQVRGVDSLGIHCDFCHKVAGVRLDPQTETPYRGMPGVLSMDIRRPFPADKDRYQLFFGTFDDDNVPQEDTRLPIIAQSEFCAPCHFGVFWDTVVYNSYGEWLASPYSDPKTGKTCQDCHTPAPTTLNGKPLTNVAPEKGGVERNPQSIHAHTFPGASSKDLLQNALTMTAEAHRQGDRIVVNVSLTNDKTGHDIPTDSPLRQMILLVEAKDDQNNLLALLEGETVPEWGGMGDPQRGYYAGLPGKAFAKVLSELWTEISPSGAYWNHTQLLSDNRLAALVTDTSQYTFNGPAQGGATVRVRLLYRRAYRSLADQKGWDIPDILMAETMVRTEGMSPPVPQSWAQPCPSLRR